MTSQMPRKDLSGQFAGIAINPASGLLCSPCSVTLGRRRHPDLYHAPETTAENMTSYEPPERTLPPLRRPARSQDSV